MDPPTFILPSRPSLRISKPGRASFSSHLEIIDEASRLKNESSVIIPARGISLAILLSWLRICDEFSDRTGGELHILAISPFILVPWEMLLILCLLLLGKDFMII